MKVGYLGPEGTNSEEACRLYIRKLEGRAELIPYTTIHDVLFAAERKEVSEAVVPIENSIEGTVGVVTDMLVKDVNLLMRQEIVLPIFHYLIAQKGVRASAITDILSHPQALDQCKEFLRKKMPKAQLHFSFSTAEAARQVATVLPKGYAAIGSLASAKLFGLSVIAKKINARDNQTRFVVLAKHDHPRTGRDKTSIVFSIAKDRPGGLHDVLAVFAERDINLTKIESRPSKKSLGDYYFFVDMEGHREDKILAEALASIKKRTSFFKMLGSYPKA
jgi:prephenate dehydratase